MSFSSLTYLVFFGIVLLVLRVAPSARLKRGFLLAASYVFYAWWDWRFVFLLAGMTVLNHYGARWVGAADDVPLRKARLTVVVGADLLILGVFKYAGFFVESANRLLEATGVRVPAVEILLPIAISFVTFEVISYVVDVYRRDLEPVRLRDVALLVAFFPHLVAGPILKPKLFLPQLRENRVVTRANLDAGTQQFIFGLMKKVLIADRLAAFVDPVMKQPDLFGTATLWLAVVAYAVQIYTDFSGYSDMAIGSARCMGFEIPPNFLAPYSARNITVFWRRWHISLSTWLREYLYFSLGGNRKGKTRQAINLMIVMLLAGLWHGASWNFVLWGGLHGAALVVHKGWMDRVAPVLRRRDGEPLLPQSVSGLLTWALTMIFVTVAWVFFRLPDFGVAGSVVARMFGFGASGGLAWYATSALLLVPLVLVADAIMAARDVTFPQVRLASFSGGFIVTSLAIAFALFWPTAATPFIYFQF